jgi:hypothetical protein
MFIGNFQGTYKCPSTAETLKAIKQKHDESLRGYVKHFCNARNIILYIQDIEIINTFLDGVSDIKTVEEIAMKKLRMVVHLRVVASVCGKGPSKKKNDQKSTQWTREITKITETMDITESLAAIFGSEREEAFLLP